VERGNLFRVKDQHNGKQLTGLKSMASSVKFTLNSIPYLHLQHRLPFSIADLVLWSALRLLSYKLNSKSGENLAQVCSTSRSSHKQFIQQQKDILRIKNYENARHCN
jgi:hypothetical protein